MKNIDYTSTLTLKHHETPAIIDRRTGEIKPVNADVKPPNGMLKFKLMDSFQRYNTKAWSLLDSQTSDVEFKAATRLGIMAQAYTNSLIPLNDEITERELAEELSINRRNTKRVIQKLFKLGVIAKFEISEVDKGWTKYWVFNPYLSFNGKVIPKKVVTLFDNTYYAKMLQE